MGMIERKKRLLMMQEAVLDTSPKIAEYGKYCGRGGTVLEEDAGWCYTEWIYFDPLPDGKTAVAIVDAYASQSANHTYQYSWNNGASTDYWYGSSDFSEYRRNATAAILEKIRWSIKIENLQDCYAYCATTGQIFFAGKNSIYYGHRNISELN